MNLTPGYAQRVMRELSLRVDGKSVPLVLTDVRFPSLALMKEGMGGIRVGFAASFPAGSVDQAHYELDFTAAR